MHINAGSIPKEHWIQQPEIGGSRIVGKICHFIDMMQYFTNAEPVKVYVESVSSENNKIIPEDNIAIVIKFNNGSVSNLTYLANGNHSPKNIMKFFELEIME